MAAAVTQVAHHGMVYVPVGYTAGANQYQLETPQGGSAYGAGTLAGGDGSRQPSEIELAHAKHQVRLCSWASLNPKHRCHAAAQGYTGPRRPSCLKGVRADACIGARAYLSKWPPPPSAALPHLCNRRIQVGLHP